MSNDNVAIDHRTKVLYVYHWNWFCFILFDLKIQQRVRLGLLGLASRHSKAMHFDIGAHRHFTRLSCQRCQWKEKHSQTCSLVSHFATIKLVHSQFFFSLYREKLCIPVIWIHTKFPLFLYFHLMGEGVLSGQGDWILSQKFLNRCCFKQFPVYWFHMESSHSLCDMVYMFCYHTAVSSQCNRCCKLYYRQV